MTERQDRESEYSPHERGEDPAPKPIWKGGDDEAPDEKRIEEPAGATPGAIAGTSAVGPVGGIIGAAAGGGLDVKDPLGEEKG